LSSCDAGGASPRLARARESVSAPPSSNRDSPGLRRHHAKPSRRASVALQRVPDIALKFSQRGSARSPLTSRGRANGTSTFPDTARARAHHGDAVTQQSPQSIECG